MPNIKKRYRYLLLILSGLLTGLTMVIPKVGVLSWISLVPAFMVILLFCSDKRVRYIEAFSYGAALFFPTYLVIIHWFLYMYPLDFLDGMTNGIALAIVLIAWLGISAFQAILGGLAFLLIAFLQRRFPLSKLPLLTPAAVGAIWVCYEFLQTLGWWGMPTFKLAVAQTGLPIGIQTASLFGAYFVSFCVVLVNGYLAYIICALMKKGSRPIEVRISAAIFCAVLLIQYGGGALLWFTSAESDDSRRVKIAVVQANISSVDQWGSNDPSKTQSIYREKTVEAASKGAEIVVWSETALPDTVSEDNYISRYISRVAKESGVTVMAGAFTEDDEGNQYNSVVCFTPDGKMQDVIYSKKHLVPFGEFAPLKEFFEKVYPPLVKLMTSGSDLAAGDDAAVMFLDNVAIAGGVCYDAMFEDVTLNAAQEGAELIYVSSNDSWFKDSVYLDVHNAQIQLRAVECGRYIAHAANTGSSAVVTHRGKVISSLEANEEGVLCEIAEVRNTRTLYSYVGNLFVYICAFSVLLCIIISVFVAIAKKFIVKKSKN